jgi:GH35 family endo-1,4-beta-xylanase
MLSTYFDPSVAGKAYGGFGLRAPITPALPINDQTYVEFDLYYPQNAMDKYMRFEIWSTSSGGEGHQGRSGFPGTNRTQAYIRTVDLDNTGSLNPDWIGFHKGETWFRKSICTPTPVTTGIWEYLNIDLHTETGAKLSGELLFLGNVRITQTDPNGTPIPNIVNSKKYNEVDPVKKKYNPDNGYYLIGTSGTKAIDSDSLRGYHFEIFVDDNNLKPEVHISSPQWLRDEYPNFTFNTDNKQIEWKIPTSSYLSIRDADISGKYKLHGHCLAWSNQSPPWMRQLIPENITSMEWNKEGLYYTGSNNAAGPFLKVKKETARRVYFDHIQYVLRHFMSTDTRYGSSRERGLIPFHSFDVVNVEIHESRHTSIIKNMDDEWATALKHVSWLIALTDDDYGDVRQHYMYLLFKYAHIAVPNARMAAAYKEGFNNPDIVPEYMKLDNHDKNGSIDDYINENPPVLVYNEYDISSYSKTKVIYNMIKELNTVWKSDPLYDGRNLIECLGIQGHESVSPSMVSRSQSSIVMITGLIEDGLLDSICFSEIDIKQPDSAPGGVALAPAVLNQKQADAVGYQYALLFRMFEKFKKYIDHVIIWSPMGSSWMDSYVLFDHQEMASQAYYGIMDPDRFIKGHSYLDEYFAGEYDRIIF